jgi:hypothetical protein
MYEPLGLAANCCEYRMPGTCARQTVNRKRAVVTVASSCLGRGFSRPSEASRHGNNKGISEYVTPTVLPSNSCGRTYVCATDDPHLKSMKKSELLCQCHRSLLSQGPGLLALTQRSHSGR